MHDSRGSNLRRKRPDHNVFAFELRCGAKHSQFAGDYRTGRGGSNSACEVGAQENSPGAVSRGYFFDALLRTHCVPRRPAAADLDAGQRVSRLSANHYLGGLVMPALVLFAGYFALPTGLWLFAVAIAVIVGVVRIVRARANP